MRFSEDRVETLICSDGKGRNIHIWESPVPKAIFIAVHGGMAHGGDYITPALFLKKHGITTIAHDQHGHDHKEKVYVPRFSVFLDDLNLLIDRTRSTYPELPVFMMGHSIGALIATHFELSGHKNTGQIRGFILSSPYYVNIIKSPPILLKLLGIISALMPKMAMPIEDISDFLTHDTDISNRHKEDEQNHIRASRISARFSNEIIKAQQYIPENIERWSHPLFCVVAGNDHLANSQSTLKYFEKIDKNLLTLYVYPENYHENFNELNREEIFNNILEWIDPLI